MASDGKQLEQLVAFIERTLLPAGFTVQTNRREYRHGAQVAEFDVEIRGELGSTKIAWLIECRDRPSDGPAPNAWIQQLVGRRDQFNFNKVTAVSTTGFASGALEYAASRDIELREVRALSQSDFEPWLRASEFLYMQPHAHLVHVDLAPCGECSVASLDAFHARLAALAAGEAGLIHVATGMAITLRQAFDVALVHATDLCADLEPNGASKLARIVVRYPSESEHYYVELTGSRVRIESIDFWAEVSLRQSRSKVIESIEYLRSEGGSSISQTAVFGAQNIGGHQIVLELHHVAKSGETHVVLRKLREVGRGD
jgi:hypothetical protein